MTLSKQLIPFQVCVSGVLVGGAKERHHMKVQKSGLKPTAYSVCLVLLMFYCVLGQRAYKFICIGIPPNLFINAVL